MVALAGGASAFTVAFDDELNMTPIPYGGVGSNTLLRRIVRAGEQWYAGSNVGLLVFDGEKWALDDSGLPRNGTNTQHLDPPYDAVAYDSERLLIAGRNRRVSWREAGVWQDKAQTASDPITYSAVAGRDLWALGVVGQVLTAPKDLGAAWTVWNLGGQSADIHAAAYGGGRYVFIGEFGHSSTFTDQEGPAGRVGSHLDLDALPDGTRTRDVTFGKGLFVAVGEGVSYDLSVAANIYTSPDGVTWTPRELSWPTGMEHTWYGAWTPLRGVAWTGKHFIAVGHAGKFVGGPAESGVAGIWASTDAVTWEHIGVGIVTASGMGPDLRTVGAQVKVRTLPPQRISGRLRSRATAFA
jgi:hypothetical protein